MFRQTLPSKLFVFDLTGSRHAYGDVSGPLWTLIDLRKHFPSSRFFVLVDKRAEDIILELYSGLSLSSLSKELQLEFVKLDQVQSIPQTDYFFQLFYEGRNLGDFYNYPFVTSWTAVIMSDTLHGRKLNELRIGNRHFYFKPPGLGSQRSGIVSNPALDLFQGKTKELRKRALSFVLTQESKGGPLEELFISEKIDYQNIKYAFMYGLHNELFAPQLKGQFGEYIEALVQANAGKYPVIIFSPSSELELRTALVGKGSYRFDLNLKSQVPLENQVYILSLPKISNQLFTALLSISDFPVLIEGDGSISTALKLQVPFVLYRSLWNGPLLHEVMLLEKTTSASHLYQETCEGKNRTPGTLKSLTIQLSEDLSGDTTRGEKIVQSMSQKLLDLSVELARVIDAVDRLLCLRNQCQSIAEYSVELSKFTDQLIQSKHDEVLAYSIAFDSHKNGEMDDFTLRQLAKKMRKLGFSIPALESRFVPTRTRIR